MQPFLDAIRALGKKPIVAAFLSFLFPGLGQAAAGQRSRGLIVSIPMLGVIGAFLVILIFDRSELFGLAVNQQWLTSLLVLDLVALIYHIWAVVDSYLVASKALPKKRRGTGPPRSSGKWVATLGILVLLSGTVAIHGSVAKVDMDWQHALYCLTAKIPCWVTDNVGDPNSGDNGGDNGGDISDVPTDSPDASGSHGSPTPMPTYDFSNIQTFNTTKDSQAWDADRELNVLLLGLGVQKGSSAGKLGPDTIMVLHVGLDSGNAEMISVGRNNTCTPLPTQEIAQHYASSSNGCPAYTFGPMLFNIPNEILGHCDKWPIPEFTSTCGQSNDENRYVRAYKGFEMTIGNLLGIHIDGSMWTNPLGLTTLINALGGVTIKVDQKLVDQPCGYSKDPSNGLPDKTYQMGTQTIFDAIGKPYCPDPTHWGYFVPTGPAGVQKMQDQAASSNGGLTLIQVPGHPYDVAFIIRPGTYKFNGDWALAYARTRIFLPNGDFDRAAHQQILLKSLKKGLADPCQFASLSAVGPILGAVQAVPYGFNSDLDVTNPQNLQAWAGLAKFLSKDISQLVLKPSTVGMSGYAWDPKSIAKAQQLVKDNFLPAATTTGGGGSSC